jgi:hypothetical protein
LVGWGALIRVRPAYAVTCCTVLMVGCGGAPETAAKNRTFYDWSAATSSSAAGQYEQRYPRLDFSGGDGAYLGVTVVRGGVRLSRPKGWALREASNEAGRAFIQYISPSAYSFAIYERPDAPTDLWRDVLSRYEDDVTSVGAKIVGKRIPVATWRGQGRAYTVERSVEAVKKPYISRSREILLRGEHRIVLVQVVQQMEDLSSIDQELLRVVGSLEVL